MFRKIDRTNTFNDVLKQIIAQIQTGELKPGDALPAERILAEELGISRPALREVLKALSLPAAMPSPDFRKSMPALTVTVVPEILSICGCRQHKIPAPTAILP